MSKMRTTRNMILICMLFLHAIATVGWSDELLAWGSDDYGVVSNAPSGNDFVAVACGALHGVAIKSDDSLIAWGNDSSGQVSNTPTGNDFVAVAVGGNHNVALKSDGRLVAWGSDNYGQVSDTPTGNDFVAVATGHQHNVALKSDGSLVSWGVDIYRQVGDTPVGNDFVAIAAGQYHSVAVKSDGRLVAWGRDYWQQVSNAPTGNDFVDVSAGPYHSVALRTDGRLISWGMDTFGQVSGTPTDNDFVVVVAAEVHSVALKSDGSLVAWGSDRYGQVSDTPTDNDFTTVSASGQHNVVIRRTTISPTYTLITSVSPVGSGSIAKYPDKASYNANESVQFTATANPGYTFSHWSVNGVTNYSNPMTVTMNSNKTVTANFTATVSKPTVSIAVTDASAGEPSNDGSFRISRTGDTSSNLLVYYSTSGSTASAGTDYAALPSYVYIPSGYSSATISVDVINDYTAESSETVRLTISSNTAYTVGSPSYATVTITDDDDVPPPVDETIVTITALDASAAEPADDGSFRISRTGDTASSLRVYYSTSGSTASAGSDYVAIPSYVDFLSGQSSATIDVVVINDYTVESSETVKLTIYDLSTYDVGSPGSATVTIADDDDVPPPVDETIVTITAPDASAAEPADDGSFRISRTGDTASSLRVYYSTSGSTASAGTDYVAIPYYVDFSSGQTSATIDVVVNNDYTVESTETVTLTIYDLSTYDVGSPGSATVSIADDDSTPPPVDKPVVTITAIDASAGEPSNDGSFRVSRTGDTGSSLRVYYSASGTASAGSDYAVLSGYVDIPSLQSSATISVDVINDYTMESSESLRLTISSNTAYDIGSPYYATVTITDDDDVPDPPVVDVVQLMAETIYFFDSEVKKGTLVSTSGGKTNLVIMGKRLDYAYDQIVDGNYTGACTLLKDTYLRCDGLVDPPDYVEGSSTDELAWKILEVIDALGCL